MKLFEDNRKSKKNLVLIFEFKTNKGIGDPFHVYHYRYIKRIL